jgi:hypothetical protein
VKSKVALNHRTLLLNRVEELLEECGADWKDRLIVSSMLQSTAYAEIVSNVLLELAAVRTSMTASPSSQTLPKDGKSIPNTPAQATAPNLYAPVNYLTERELAELLNVSLALVRKWRSRGGGPKCTRFGRIVRYRYSDVQAFFT